MTELTRHFPDVLAVDPKGCGCTECLIGEYVPSERWYASALPGDVEAVMEDFVRDNTYYGFNDLLQSFNYSMPETREFLEEFYRYRETEEVLKTSYFAWRSEG